VAIVKHAHHNFDIDFPGKDSFRLRKAGATETLVASKHRWALIHETKLETAHQSPESIVEDESNQDEPDLFELITHLDHSQLDLILVEGFKHEAIPRIELHRKALNNDLLNPTDKHIIAIATDSTENNFGNLLTLDINNPRQIAQFIIKEFIQD
jgi:molybdopterin-guanine dinucleotide biosynthesis protein B